MASSGNFATWNPLANTQAGLSYSGSVYSNGNTRFRGNTGGTATTQLTHGLSSGKWYIEIYIDGSPAGGFPMIGIVASGANSTTLQNTSNAAALAITSDLQTVNGTKRVFGSTSSTSYGSGFSDTDICQMAIDIDNGKIWWGKNNTWFASGDPAAGSNAGDTFTGGTEMMVFVGSYSGAAYSICNAGQDDTFAGNVTAAGNADGNGFGDFKYAPPTGFLALCSANLPISADIDPAGDDGADDNPTKQFNTVLYSGTGSAQSIDAGLQADFVWAKNRGSQSHRLADSTRGSAVLFSDSTSAEDTTAGITFDSEGFNWTNTDGSNANDSGASYVAWCWKANGGTTASNTSGDINSTTQANTKGGFSIVTYTGNGSVAQSIGHGLSSGAPELIFVKNRSQADAWAVYHVGIGNAAHLILDTTAAQTTSSAYWGSFTPTTTLFKVGNDHKLNASSENYVAYLWHGVEGFSKFGTYVGNGNADGPFIYTGFRPAMYFVKNATAANGWFVYDKLRDGFNDQNDTLSWQDSTAEDNTYEHDIYSNGFKPRDSNNATNQSGQTFIYGAWADVPFKYNNAR